MFRLFRNCLEAFHNIADLHRLALKQLPAPMFHYIDGAAGDEWAMRHDTTAFDRNELVGRYLIDVSGIDTATTVLGQTSQWPLFCAPTRISHLLHHEGEREVVMAAAAQSGSTFCTSVREFSPLEVCAG